jgi:hypothetical protein
MKNVNVRMAAYVILFGLAGFGLGTYNAETETFSITLTQLSAALTVAGGLFGGLGIFKVWGTK